MIGLHIKCIADLARTGGDASKIVSPGWNREILTARIPPQISPEFVGFLQRLGSTGNDVMLSTPPEEMSGRFFLFGPGDMASLRRHAPVHLTPPGTSSELLTAVMWRCRTVALDYEPHHRLVPHGFYGNAVFYPMTDTIVG